MRIRLASVQAAAPVTPPVLHMAAYDLAEFLSPEEIGEAAAVGPQLPGLTPPPQDCLGDPHASHLLDGTLPHVRCSLCGDDQS